MESQNSSPEISHACLCLKFDARLNCHPYFRPGNGETQKALGKEHLIIRAIEHSWHSVFELSNICNLVNE